ncbi:hypothetical protein Tco_0265287 [Tanacetum coccineum]
MPERMAPPGKWVWASTTQKDRVTELDASLGTQLSYLAGEGNEIVASDLVVNLAAEREYRAFFRVASLEPALSMLAAYISLSKGLSLLGREMLLGEQLYLRRVFINSLRPLGKSCRLSFLAGVPAHSAFSLSSYIVLGKCSIDSVSSVCTPSLLPTPSVSGRAIVTIGRFDRKEGTSRLMLMAKIQDIGPEFAQSSIGYQFSAGLRRAASYGSSLPKPIKRDVKSYKDEVAGEPVAGLNPSQEELMLAGRLLPEMTLCRGNIGTFRLGHRSSYFAFLGTNYQASATAFLRAPSLISVALLVRAAIPSLVRMLPELVRQHQVSRWLFHQTWLCSPYCSIMGDISYAVFVDSHRIPSSLLFLCGFLYRDPAGMAAQKPYSSTGAGLVLRGSNSKWYQGDVVVPSVFFMEGSIIQDILERRIDKCNEEMEIPEKSMNKGSGVLKVRREHSAKGARPQHAILMILNDLRTLGGQACLRLGYFAVAWDSLAITTEQDRRSPNLPISLSEATITDGKLPYPLGIFSPLQLQILRNNPRFYDLRKEATKPKGRSLLAFPIRDASLFVITALKMFSGIREDGALSSALWLFACDKERVN